MRFFAPKGLLALCLVLLLPVCGTIKSGVTSGINAMRSLAEDQIEGDLRDRPYMACAFDATAPELMNAMQSAFMENGYGIGSVSSQTERIETDPVSVEEAGDHYELEILTGIVYELDGENVVYLTHEQGPSMSRLGWEERPVGERGDERSYLVQRVTLWDRRYYEGLMPAIAAEVGEEPCE